MRKVSDPEKIPAVLDDDYCYEINGDSVYVLCHYDFDEERQRYNRRYVIGENWQRYKAGCCRKCGTEMTLHDTRRILYDSNPGGGRFELSYRTGYCERCIETKIAKAKEVQEQNDKRIVVVDRHESRWSTTDEVYEIIETYSDGSTWSFSPSSLSPSYFKQEEKRNKKGLRPSPRS